MAEYLTYREAAVRTKRSIRSINRWRRGGMPMEWEKRGDQRVRVVRLDILLAWWRDRLNSDPAHQYRLRRMRAEQDARHAE
jgi:phage terminase Nu1 subunit (DNA packaging protein)